jgi:uncharacterized membrane protein HdeD (DUF308 family)
MNQTIRPESQFVHRIWSSTMVSGLLAAILGAVILLWPGPSIVAASAVFGVYLVVSGVALIALALRLPSSTASKVLNFIGGVASVILGILAFRHFGDGYAVLLLATWIGVGGAATLGTVIADKQFPGRGWAVFFGIVSVLAGVVTLVFPFDSIVTLALVGGVWLVVLGVIEVASALSMRSDAKKVENLTGFGAQPQPVTH